MKNSHISLLLVTFLLVTNVFATGGDSDGGAVGGNGGGQKMAKRSIASIVAVEDKETEEIIFNSAKNCLKTLKSNFIPTSLDQKNTDTIKKEISESVTKNLKEERIVDSANFPDCVFYAIETKDLQMKKLFFRNSISNEHTDREPSASISK